MKTILEGSCLRQNKASFLPPQRNLLPPNFTPPTKISFLKLFSPLRDRNQDWRCQCQCEAIQAIQNKKELLKMTRSLCSETMKRRNGCFLMMVGIFKDKDGGRLTATADPEAHGTGARGHPLVGRALCRRVARPRLSIVPHACFVVESHNLKHAEH